MRRRAFITTLGGAAAWPLVARAQSREPVRRIGVLMNLAAEDPEAQARLAAFTQGLQEANWAVGRNAQIDIRWGAGDPDRNRKYAAELIALAPDVLLGSGTGVVRALQQADRGVPIVFVNATDPVGGGLVASLARPGGNVTGFSLFEYGLSAKWLELLKQIAPSVVRVVVLRDPTLTTSIGQYAAIQSMAPHLGVELSPADSRDLAEVERTINSFGRGAQVGLIVGATPLAAVRRELIIRFAAQNRWPAVYPLRHFVTDGGLTSYGPNTVDPYRRAAAYVDRILKGEKPADLPVQAPTRYELVLNLKTARALGLDLPTALLARADEVIE
jgi:ABC-type uncharacterized transport system substrate-binding protein